MRILHVQLLSLNYLKISELWKFFFQLWEVSPGICYALHENARIPQCNLIIILSLVSLWLPSPAVRPVPCNWAPTHTTRMWNKTVSDQTKFRWSEFDHVQILIRLHLHNVHVNVCSIWWWLSGFNNIGSRRSTLGIRHELNTHAWLSRYQSILNPYASNTCQFVHYLKKGGTARNKLRNVA